MQRIAHRMPDIRAIVRGVGCAAPGAIRTMKLRAAGVIGTRAAGQFTIDGAAMTPEAMGNLALVQILFKPGLNLIAFVRAEMGVTHW